MWTFLLLAIALVPPAAGAPSPPAAPGDSVRSMPGDSVRSVVRRGFEIYATSDEALRLALGQVNYAEQQFGRYMGKSPPKLAVLILDAPGQVERFDLAALGKRGLPVLRWVPPPAAGGPAPASPAGASAAPGERPPLSHEAGRAFFEAFAAAQRAGAAGPRVPDWIEEAIGGLCEPPALQNDRLAYMRDRIERRIPLPELFRMERPGSAASGAAGSAARRPTAARKSRAAPPRPAGDAAERAALFSAEALSLGSYIAEVEGDRFVGRIALALVNGKTVGDALVDAVVAMSKAEVLERQWVEWVRQKR